ncbi:uncharacterized protein [Triticum aestivum]|uniref:uncharacterized protein n=1 Tax=Triticum aestivum TaxID=4565 RepID=UPI001D007764|nr:uncharacterized protein LOC123065588 [Triticum aestivum]
MSALPLGLFSPNLDDTRVCSLTRCASLVLRCHRLVLLWPRGSMFRTSEPIPDVFPVESRDLMSITDTQLGHDGKGTPLCGDADLGLLKSHQRLDHEWMSPMDEFAEAQQGGPYK